MSIDLDRDLRTYVSYLDSVTASAVEPIEPDEILAAGDQVPFLETETDSQTPLSQHRRGPWVAVVAVVTILVFVGLFPLLTNGDSEAVGTLDPTTVRPFVVGLDGPNDVVFDPSGGLFISADGRVGRVEILPDGTAGGSMVIGGPYDDLRGLALGENGVVYFANYGLVMAVAAGSATGHWTDTPFARGFDEPLGLAIDTNLDLYVADPSASGIRIIRISVLGDGTAGTATGVGIVPGGPRGDPQAGDIEFGPTGELFVVNNMDEIWAVTLADDGSMASLRLFASITGDPRALAFDASGTLYVGTTAGTVWSVDSAGEPTMVATGFDSIGGMAFDASGALYLTGETEVLKVLRR